MQRLISVVTTKGQYADNYYAGFYFKQIICSRIFNFFMHGSSHEIWRVNSFKSPGSQELHHPTCETLIANFNLIPQLLWRTCICLIYKVL